MTIGTNRFVAYQICIHQKYYRIHRPIRATLRILVQNLKIEHHTSSQVWPWAENWLHRFNIITIYFYWIVLPRWCSNTMRITLSYQLAVPRQLDYLKQPLYIQVVIDDNLLERQMPLLFPAACKPKNLSHQSCCFLGLFLIWGVISTKDNA